MPPPTRRYFTPGALAAAGAARRAKRDAKLAEPDRFGVPELFVVKAGPNVFAWELRRFGGVVLQRSSEAFPSQAAARTDGEMALTALCASPDLPTFKRELGWKGASEDASRG